MSDKRNSCITLHQPWASLLVHGIKRIEGREWPCPMRGRLWIHAASKVPDPANIKAMEKFYREAYKLDGVNEIRFPEYYPVSVLLGCVNVVGCLREKELKSWDRISPGVRMEGQTAFCWLCEDPQKLVVPLEMRGQQRVYKLQNKILDSASRALRPAQGPCPVVFPSLELSELEARSSQEAQNSPQRALVDPSSPKLDAAIAGARVAALQFRKQEGRMNERHSVGNSSTYSARSSSSGQANLGNSTFQFGENTSPLYRDDGNRRGSMSSVDTGSNGQVDSRQINASRRRVGACRVFDHALRSATGERSGKNLTLSARSD